MKLRVIVLLSLLVQVGVVQAQHFKLMRFNEDYSALRDSTRTLYQQLKYLPLSPNGQINISFGGEARIEVDRTQNEDWGARNVGKQLFLLQRYHLHADVHFGKRIRIFGQLRSGLENGRKMGPRLIDEDQLNVQNLFMDVVPYQNAGHKLTLRLGRQELQYGSGRLIDVQEGPNLRLYFDGAKAAYSSTKLNIDGFVMAKGEIKTGYFDNTVGRKVSLWGVYSTWFATKQLNIDLSYLGINRADAKFDEGIAYETRHAIAGRFWNSASRFLYNLEMSYQLGKFGKSKIGAWGGSADIGYKLSGLKGSPMLNLRSDLVSGDKTKGDGRLGTMNPLYPNGGYFGAYPQAGPANLISLHPSLAWNPSKNVHLSLETVCYWRHSLQDGIYRPSGIFNLSSLGSAKRYIGTTYLTTVSWAINKHLNYILAAQYFETGAHLNEILPQHKNGVFFTSLMAFKF